MNILFLSIGDIPSIKHREIYPDLMREFIKNNHNVYVICSREKRNNLATEFVEEDGAKLVKVKIGNITKTNLIEKGVSTLLVSIQYKLAIKKFFPDVQFDLIMYSTPPITLVDCIEYVKKRDDAKTYLLLKDIFPQNAVDLGMFTQTGLKSAIYKYFRNKESKIYRISDHIGCMSQANVEYVLKHNSELDENIVEVCPNSVDVVDMSVDAKTRENIRKKYDIPTNKKILIYGGNLGKPQGIDFLIECLKSQYNRDDVYFLIVGDGTEFGKLESYMKAEKPMNVKLMKRLPKDDYDTMVAACDVGMIFLDYRFTIPNFPSRLLAYMQAKIPVLACTDPNTDIGKVITEGGFGWWCESNSIQEFTKIVDCICSADLKALGDNAYRVLNEKYSVSESYNTIVNHF
ncbi:glycosyltransferase family 4 protein [Eubacterium sp. ER2]|uniref:glycosyltransferase family 4 protein n=1 Tax=Eubacterium sp. ER2 TaxID=1519438 RepID=UPI00051C98AE|nr:glycosyltransferase family 4 protein [Eubacterium sp. ER2]